MIYSIFRKTAFILACTFAFLNASANQFKIELDTVEPKEPVKEEVLTVAEEMPIFPNCNTGEEEFEMRKCSEKQMLTEVYKNIQYPKEAREKGVQGVVVVQFVVNKTGEMEGVKIVKGLGDGCDEEIIRVVTAMKELGKWTPGKQDGKVVNVRYRLSVRFRLYTNNDDIESIKPKRRNKRKKKKND